MHRFDLAALPATPWKNGGGTTREIACPPEGAAFDWRVSVATIAAAGPFSAFAGVDRVIVLLAGDGVHLRGDGIDHRLATPLAPFAFAGDAAVDCTLLGRASTDFNLMTRRGRARGALRVLRVADDLAAAPAGVLFAVGGGWRCDDETLPADHGLWWHGETRGWQAVPLDADAALIAVHIETTA